MSDHASVTRGTQAAGDRRRRRLFWRSLVLVIALGCAGVALSTLSRGARPPNVVLIVVDTLRADKLGVYGNGRGLTPFLDELAQRGTVFLNTYAASSWTCPSVASIMTSRYPAQHRVTGFGSRLAAEEVTLAEAVHPLGYVGGGFSANFRLLERLGYAQGFAFWRSDVRMPGGLSGTELNRQALGWLHGAWQPSSSRPLLLFLQYMEPHGPYDPPEPFRSVFAPEMNGATDRIHQLQLRMLAGNWEDLTRTDFHVFEDLYDGEVATVDAEIRSLFAELGRRGVLDNAIVIVTADHGEEFWEHGGLTHGRTLFNESVKVPLIIIAPGHAPGQRVSENVSLIDVAPTLLELLGLPPEPRFEGRSLVPLLRARSAPDGSGHGLHAAPAFEPGRDILLQLEPTGLKIDGRVHAEGLVHRSLKLLVRPEGEGDTYDLAADPGELQPNTLTVAGQSIALLRALETSKSALDRRASPVAAGEELSEATLEKLRALGYHF